MGHSQGNFPDRHTNDVLGLNHHCATEAESLLGPSFLAMTKRQRLTVKRMEGMNDANLL